MKAVIVEDEFIAAQSLERLIKTIDKHIAIEAVLQSVDESVEWFSTHTAPDVVFMDIHLADGDSFAIFDKIDICCPIIFTTAYDEYALKAFEVNSIDYLLKPITQKSLEKALDKLKQFSFKDNNAEIIAEIAQSIRKSKNSYKKHFLIPYKDKLIPLPAENIAFIYSEFKMAKIVCLNKQAYAIDMSLDEFLRQLNPSLFFRANRQYIVSHKAITDLAVWFGGKLSINLSVETPERIIVSRARSGEFKNWYMENCE